MALQRRNGKTQEQQQATAPALPVPVAGEALSDWNTNKRSDFEAVKMYVGEVVNRGIDFTKNPDDWEIVVHTLAFFSEHGRVLAQLLSNVSKHHDTATTDAYFDKALKESQVKSISRFKKMCAHFNITMAQIKENNKVVTELKDQLPEGVNPDDYIKHGFYEQGGAYYAITKDGPKMVCGFNIKVLYLVKSKTNPKRIVEIKNTYGQKAVLDLPTDAFVSIGSFKKAVESVGNFVFEGTETDLTKLKKKLFREERVTTEITTLGWNERGRFYSFANGVYNGSWNAIDEYGIVSNKEQNYFLPYMSSIYDGDEDYTNEKRFRHRANDATFARWSELVYQSYGPNGAMGICFCIASLFRDMFFNLNNCFPMLFCFGERQSGKSTFAESFKYLFGEAQDSISLENPSTIVGVIRTLANFSNAVVVLDEYKNSIDKKSLGMLKGLYDGFGRTTGIKSNDNQTKVVKPRSSVFTMGQDMPTIDNALFTRYIMLEFRSIGRNYSAFEALKNMEKRGLTSVTLEVLQHRAALEKTFAAGFQIIYKFLKEEMEEFGIEDRMFLNMASILTPALYMMENGLLHFPFSKEELVDMGMAIIKRQHEQISNSTDANRFWDIFVALVRSGDLKEGFDYKFHKGKLYIRLGNVHPLYMERHRQINNMVGQDKTTIDYYLKNSYAFDGIENLRFKIPASADYNGKYKTTSPTSAYGFVFDKLDIDLHQTEEENDLQETL
jgi:hypothetical protein